MDTVACPQRNIKKDLELMVLSATGVKSYATKQSMVKTKPIVDHVSKI
jgi:hypothetical protein